MLRSFWHSKQLAIILIAGGFFLRLIALLQSPQPYDMGTFHSWGNHVWTHGLFTTYQNIWSDYLPLPMLLFGAIRGISSFFPLSYPDFFRVFWMVCEGLLIYAIAHNTARAKLKTFLTLWLFLPFIANTGWWGQIDSIPTLLTLLALYRLHKSDKWGSGFAFAIAVALKPIMLIAGLVFLILGWQKKALPQLLIAGILTLATTALPAVVNNLSDITIQTPQEAFSFVVTQAMFQSSMYPGTTINAWNLWSVQGTFWAQDTSIVLGLTAQQWGYFMFTLCVIVIMRAWHKTHWSQKHAIFVAGQLLLCFYVVTTRMHERHLMFALPFLILGSQGALAKISSFALSLLYLGNLWGALYWVNNAQAWPFSQTVLAGLSWLVVLLTTTLLFFTQDIRAYLTNLHIKSHLPEIILVLFILVSRLINLHHPITMVFDEVYHSFTAQEYLHGSVVAWEWWTTPPTGFAYEWTHPPLAKYGMMLGMLLFGEDSFGWRLGSVIAGTLSIIGLYALAQELTRSRAIARLAMLLAAFEGLHLVQSRTGMNDAYLLMFLVWSFVFALRTRYKQAAILFGLALASKWSAIYGLVPLALIYLMHAKWAGNYLKNSLYILRLLLVIILVYLLSFTPFLLSGHTSSQLVELHRQMWFYHTGLQATHNYQSTPLQWVIAARPVWYWVNYDTELSRSNIYAQGNPLLLWFGLASFAVLLTRIRRYWLELTLCAIFTLPWIISPRIMFFYHYLPTAFFLSLPSAYLINRLPKVASASIITLFIMSFFVLTPLYYGYSMPNTYWNTVFNLFPTWK